MPLIPILGRQKQMELCEIKASLVSIVRRRMVVVLTLVGNAVLMVTD